MVEGEAASARARSVVAGARAPGGRFQSCVRRALAGRTRARRRESSQAALDVADVRTLARKLCRDAATYRDVRWQPVIGSSHPQIAKIWKRFTINSSPGAANTILPDTILLTRSTAAYSRRRR